MDKVQEFAEILNGRFPFESYRFKNPESITSVYDEALLTEIVLSKVDPTSYEVYDKDRVQVVINDSFRFALSDFDEVIQDYIAYLFKEDFGQYEWQSLFVDYEGDEEEMEYYNDVFITKLERLKEENEKNPSKWIPENDYVPTELHKAMMTYTRYKLKND